MSMGDLESRVRRLEELARFSPRGLEEKIIGTAQAIRMERSSPRAAGPPAPCNGLLCITVHGCYNPEGGFALKLYKGGVDGELVADIVTDGLADCFPITEAGLYTAVITKDGYSDSPRIVEIEADCGRTDVSVTMVLDEDYECLPCCATPTPKTFVPSITDMYGTRTMNRDSGQILACANNGGYPARWVDCVIDGTPAKYVRYCLDCFGSGGVFTMTRRTALITAGFPDCTFTGTIFTLWDEETVQATTDPTDCSVFDLEFVFDDDTVTVSGTP